MPIEFSVSPLLLSLMALLFVAACLFFRQVHRRSLTDMSAGRKRLALGLRLTIVLLLFLALAGLRWVRRNDAISVVFLVDASKSIRDDQKEAAQHFVQEAVKAKRPGDRVGVITFGADPDIRTQPVDRPDLDRLQYTGATNATNIAEALGTALSIVPRETAGKVVVLSDGNENVGSALAEVPSLTARSIPIDSVLLPSGLKKEALIEKMIVPSRVKIGEPFTVQVIVNALNSQHGRLTLRRDGQPVGAPHSIDIPAGRRVHSFEMTVPKAGLYRLEASLDTDPHEDTLPENNTGLGFISVRGKPQILYVSPTPSLMGFLQKALKPQNVDVLYAPPSAMPTTAAAFQRFDSILLSDVPRDAFSLAQLTALQVSTHDFGVGFGMIGGENSFGLGGYRHTAVEEMLPVSLDVKKQLRLPSVAVALVIEDLEIPTSVNMSKEAAKALVDLLDPLDEVGVLDCSGMGSGSGGGTWRIPMQHVTDRAAIRAKIDSLDDMGDPPSYDPFLIEAARRLQSSQASVRHIVFLGDGDAIWEGGGGGTLATLQKIRNMNITVSTVSTGADRDGINFMAGMASAGKGRAYVVDQPQEMLHILLKDYQTLSAPPIVEEPFTPRIVPGADSLMPGIAINGMPPLLGYNATEAKPTADVLIVSHRNDPVLATWRYGLGRTMAFTSDDKNKWAVHWLPWSGYGKFWAEAIRWTMRSFTPADFQTQVTTEGTRGHVVVDALDREGRFVNGLNFRARVAGPDTDSEKPAPELPLRQTAPGRCETTFDAAQIGTYLVNVMRQMPDKTVASTVTGLVVPYSPEYKDLTANEFLMRRLGQAGGGGLLTVPAQVFDSNRPVIALPLELSPGLLLLALLLFPLDVAVRRLTLQQEDFRRAANWVRGRLLRGRNTGGRATAPEPARQRAAPERVQVGAYGIEETRLESRLGAATEQSRGSEETTAVRAAPSARSVAGTVVTPVSSPSTPRSDEPMPSQAEAPASDAPAAAPEGMGRLMAAKRRAQEQLKPKDPKEIE